MLYKTIIFVLIMLVSQFLPAQQDTGSDRTDLDYHKFKQTYDKEVSNDTIRFQETIVHPASLPDIFSNIPSSNSKTIYAIGISDPGMEKYLAIDLAIIRAKMVAAFMVFPEVGILTDNYSNEELANQSTEYASRYSDFFQLLSKLEVDSNSFQVQKIEFTSFDEAVVLLSYIEPNDKKEDYFIAEANVFQNERQKQVRFDAEGKFDMNGVEKHGDSITSSTSYIVTTLNNTSEIQSVIDNVHLDFRYNNYRYTADSANKSNNESYPTGTKLTYGLWKAFAEHFLNKICQYSQNTTINVKQVDDNYNAGKQTLSRELVRSQIKFQLSDVIVFNNRLSVNIDSVN